MFYKRINRKAFSYFIILLLLCVVIIESFGLLLAKNEYFLLQLSLVDNTRQKLLPQKSCRNIPEFTSKYQCWEKQLELTLKENGINSAFSVFDYLYRSESQFASGCHGYAHRLGEVTYGLFVNGRDFDFPSQTAYCGYGFYHGLTELLLQSKGPKEAGKLCDSKRSEMTQVLYDACYHGIGHGALSSTASDSSVWGNVQRMIDLALNTCKKSTDDLIEQSRCASGVFMELGNLYSEGKLQLASIKNDPLKICREQQEFGKMDCYTQMNGVLNMIGRGKLAESARFVEAIEEDKYAVAAIITLAAPTINITKGDFTEDIETCRILQSRLHLPCIKGLVLGFLLKGSPGVEYEKAINFCKLPTFSEDERKSCYELLLRHSSEMYDVGTLNVICSKVESKQKRNYCPTH